MWGAIGFHKTFRTACIRQYIRLTFLITISNYFPSTQTRCWESLAFRACLWFSAFRWFVVGRSACLLYEIHLMASLSTWLPSILTFSMYDGVEVSSCIPFCRASQMYTMWPPAWNGFHVSCRVFIMGPPALSGFPYTHNKASGTHRLPCVYRTW